MKLLKHGYNDRRWTDTLPCLGGFQDSPSSSHRGCGALLEVTRADIFTKADASIGSPKCKAVFRCLLCHNLTYVPHGELFRDLPDETTWRAAHGERDPRQPTARTFKGRQILSFHSAENERHWTFTIQAVDETRDGKPLRGIRFTEGPEGFTEGDDFTLVPDGMTKREAFVPSSGHVHPISAPCVTLAVGYAGRSYKLFSVLAVWRDGDTVYADLRFDNLHVIPPEFGGLGVLEGGDTLPYSPHRH